MKTYLIDLDGTMYRGNQNIDGAREFIAYCLKKGQPFYFLTNNSSRTRAQNVKHMLELGFEGIEEKHFFTSAMAAALYAKDLNRGHKAAYIGMDGLREALLENGFEIDEKQADFVFVGLDKQADYTKYSKMLKLCLQGAQLIGTNDDRKLAVAESYDVGNGAIVKMFEYASEQQSPQIGKPYSVILDKALETFHLNKEEVILIGDNLETDIALGMHEGVETILVLSGVHDEKDVERLQIYPNQIVHSLYELMKE